ncbi:helix-turn-helix domain-containing protein [Actinoplanes rectilineatus]|uniref:helix-turn-helix domain-containing protein n=1 Tax=Actinoplanes rectilineatus TaxID=113571 RepID=UPI000698275B|nr:helix-turn-helix domain-containing protein [Actinoplanes rectilineatus]
MTGRSVVDGAFRLLRALPQAGAEHQLARLAKLTGLPRPTVHRLLGQLRDTGAVDWVDGRWTLSPSLLGITRQIEPVPGLRRIAAAVMQTVREQTGATVSLVVPTVTPSGGPMDGLSVGIPAGGTVDDRSDRIPAGGTLADGPLTGRPLTGGPPADVLPAGGVLPGGAPFIALDMIPGREALPIVAQAGAPMPATTAAGILLDPTGAPSPRRRPFGAAVDDQDLFAGLTCYAVGVALPGGLRASLQIARTAAHPAQHAGAIVHRAAVALEREIRTAAALE